MKRMRKIEREMRARYFKGAVAIFAEMGAHETSRRDATDGHEDTLSAAVEYEIMTAAGRLHVTVYDDWTHTRFADPKQAVQFVDANRFSGKWNHHAFIDQMKHPTPAWVDGHLESLRMALGRIEARRMTDDEWAAFVAKRDADLARWAAQNEEWRRHWKAPSAA